MLLPASAARAQVTRGAHSHGSAALFSYWRTHLFLEPDLDPLEASAHAVRTTLDELPAADRARILSRWRPAGPKRPSWMAPAPEAQLDVYQILSLLHEVHGSRELALAAFFLGPEPVARARQRLRTRWETHSLRKVARKLERPARRDLPFVQKALRWATLYSLSWPVDRRFRITSGFGERFHPVRRRHSNHFGVDIGVPAGTEIRAPASGVVRRIRYGRANGRWLEIDHGDGVRTLYCHLSKIRVKPGQRVRAGQLVAKSGATGRVTGPHLHYQVKVAGRFVDPLGVRASPEASVEPLSLAGLTQPAAGDPHTASR